MTDRNRVSGLPEFFNRRPVIAAVWMLFGLSTGVNVGLWLNGRTLRRANENCEHLVRINEQALFESQRITAGSKELARMLDKALEALARCRAELAAAEFVLRWLGRGVLPPNDGPPNPREW